MQIEITGIDEVTGKAWLKKKIFSEAVTIQQVLEALQLSAPHGVAVFNEVVSLDTKLQDGNRLDILSLLKVDPMTARRLRAEKKERQKMTTTGRHGGHHRLMSNS